MRHIRLHLERDVHNTVAFKYGRDVRVRAYVEASVVALFVFVLSQNDNPRISVGRLLSKRLYFLPRLSQNGFAFLFGKKELLCCYDWMRKEQNHPSLPRLRF